MKVSKLVEYLDRLYPFALAESWDNVGLIVGDSKAEVTGVLLCLDVTQAVLDDAIESGCNVIITHHPIIFRPIKRINQAELQGGVIAKALQNQISLVALHTNMDSAEGGLNDTLCEKLGLIDAKPLVDSGRERFYKLAVFVPEDDAGKVREALLQAGAGAIGDYDSCSFNINGTGTFRPLAGANPVLGELDKLERVLETRIEVILRREIAGRVVAAMMQAHPYEEVAHDLVPLANKEPRTGLARIGRLESPESLKVFTERVAKLGIFVNRVLGDADKLVSKVALCSGAGSDFTTTAISKKADVYLTAEIKHHHAIAADAASVAIIETDHFTLEQQHWPKLANLLEQQFEGLKTKVSTRGPKLWRRP